MPFISDSLLLNLPFHQPLKEDSTQWPDELHPETTAIAENCESSTLDFLGSCLKIKAGGKLTLPEKIRTQLTSAIQHQLTVEFWAEPASPENNQQQYLLKGPVTIWIEGNRLHWFVGKGSSAQGYQIEGVAGLHHWAIVVDQTAASTPITFFKNGIEVTNQAQPIPLTDTLIEAIKATHLEIGDQSSGWIGKLAHLRIWGTALNATQLEQNRQRDVTAHAAFKETTGIGWQLLNTDDEPSLYIHSSDPQELRLVLENTTKETTLVIPQSEQSASLDAYHFCLVFRPGTITSPLLVNQADDPFSSTTQNPLIQAICEKNQGWHISLNKRDEQDYICFLRSGSDLVLKPKGSLTLVIPGVAAVPGVGSRPSDVGLQYQQLKVQNSERHLDGHRAARLNILSRQPALGLYRKPLLEVGVVGAPVVLNNGKETCLTLYIKNTDAAPLVFRSTNDPELTLKIDLYPQHLQGLGDADDLGRIEIEPSEIDKSKIQVEKDKNKPGLWTITFKNPRELALDAGDTVYLPLINIQTTAPPGRSILQLSYKNFDKYGDGKFEIPIDRVSVIPAKLTQEGGTGYGLSMGFDPRVGKGNPNDPALDAMLAINKKKGNGDAVRIEVEDSSIENAHDGIGLNVVQKGNALAAKFSGGTGVEINGKLDARENVHIDGQLQVGKRSNANPNNGNRVAKLHVVSEDDNISGSNQPTTPDINRDLSLHWRLDNLPIQDCSSFKRVCSVNGNLQVIADSQLGNCFRFSGNEKITCPTIDLSESFDLSKSFTIQFWAKVTQAERGTAQYGFIVGQEQVPAPTSRTSNSLHIGFRYLTNKFTFAFYGNDTDVSIELDDRWHYWSCVYDRANNTRRVYRDGIRIEETENVALYSGSGPLVIGKVLENHTPPPASYKGGLADIRVHTRALSAEEISLCMRSILIPTVPIAHIENTEIASGLLVEQYGNGLAAQFKGGSGVKITGNLQVGQRIRDKTGVIMPVGAVLPFAGAIAPEGWLLCNGQQVIGEQYQDLSNVLFGEDRFVFNVPDYQEKFIAGATGEGDYVLGDSSHGEELVTLTIDHMPAHSHDHQSLSMDNKGGHSHSVTIQAGAGKGTYTQIATTNARSDPRTVRTSDEGSHSHTLGGSIGSSGKGTSHENRPPFVALNYIIKY